MKPVLCTFFILFLSTHLLAATHTAQDYLAYAYEHRLRLPPYLESLHAYHNQNLYGFSFEPIDPISATFMRDILEHNKQADTAVLEIGCGMGILAANLLALSSSNHPLHYVGVDLCYDTLAIATRHIFEDAPHNSAAWIPICGEFPNIAIDQKFTHIGLFYVAHFWTPAVCIESLKKIESLLAPGGTVYIYTTHPYTTAYGPLPQQLYDAHTGEFPGYIADAPLHFDTMMRAVFNDNHQTDEAQLRAQYIPHFLYLKAEELCAIIKKHTNLVVRHSATVTEPCSKGYKMFAGIIASSQQSF